MEESPSNSKQNLKNVLKGRLPQLSFIALLCIVLLVALSALFTRSYVINCSDYCSNQPHVACAGYWNISGQYPNCNCGYVCWSSMSCAIDSDCKTGERCYRSYENGQQVGDLICHKSCIGNSNCPEVAPYCRRVTITVGSSIDAADLCMIEECVKDSDCPQPICIGIRAVCENQMCKLVDTNGMAASCI